MENTGKLMMIDLNPNHSNPALCSCLITRIILNLKNPNKIIGRSIKVDQSLTLKIIKING